MAEGAFDKDIRPQVFYSAHYFINTMLLSLISSYHKVQTFKAGKPDQMCRNAGGVRCIENGKTTYQMPLQLININQSRAV